MKSAFRSFIVAVALVFGATSTITVGQALLAPTAAHAGILGDIKGAAKKVGGAVKHTAVGIGSAAKAGASAVKYAGKQAAIGVGSNVKRAGVKVGSVLGKTPIVEGIKDAGRAVKQFVRRKT